MCPHDIYRVYQKGRSPRLSLNRNPVEQRYSLLTSYILRRLLCYDIVQFNCECLRTGIFYESTFKHAEPNPKSSRFVDLQFSHELIFYVHCSFFSLFNDTHG